MLLSAQEVRVEGGADLRAVRLLQEVLADSRYLLIDRDTLLPADFHTQGDLLVLDATLRLEGQVEGRVASAAGTLFIRPGGRVAGSLASVGGAIYPSTLAQVGEILESPAGTRVEVARQPDGYLVRVVPPPSRPALVYPGLYGLRLPTYDRVDGVTLLWGPQWRMLRRPDGAVGEAWVAYRSARQSADGGARLAVPLGAGSLVSGEAARASLTNEGWIRGELTNTLAAAFLGSDYRDYYQSDYLELTVAWPLPVGQFQPELAVAPRLTLLASRDRSLPVQQTWSLFGGDGMQRPNPVIEEGRVLSITGVVEVAWRGQSSSFLGEALVEHALAGGDRLDFTRWLAHGRWELQALWDHRVAFGARAMGPIGEGPLPRQRWSFIGGAGTLPTLGIADLRGDRLVFIESEYAIPLSFLEIPYLGSPVIRAVHAIGAAWTSRTSMPAWEQNVGLGVRVLLLDATLFVDPAADELRPVVALGLVFTP